MRRLFLGLLCGWLMLAAIHASVAADVVEHRLENGLTVLVLPDARAPVVTNQVWYRVGSMDEHSGITGISHMLEHMMFKGSEQYPPGEFSRIVARLGGQENAFTGRDYTGYFQVVGSEHWETVMAMEAERMHGLKLAEDEFLPERRVVIEERRLRTEDQPNSLVQEQFHATAFFNQPYGHPVIGWMTDIDAYTVDDLRDWYRAWYAPNNAVVVVVGDVDPGRGDRRSGASLRAHSGARAAGAQAAGGDAAARRAPHHPARAGRTALPGHGLEDPGADHPRRPR
jgi:zinc protease